MQVEIIARVQQLLGLSGNQLASVLGVDARTISRWHSGKTEATGLSWVLLRAIYQQLEREPGSVEQLKAMTQGYAAAGLMDLLITVAVRVAKLEPLSK